MCSTPAPDFSENGFREVMLVGSGREGQVYRARYSLPVARGLIAPNQLVAIKLTKALQLRPNEVLVQARVQHRSIVQVWDVFRYTDLCGHDYIATVLELSDPTVGIPATLAALGPGSTLWTAIRKQVEMNMTGLFTKRKAKTICPVWRITRPDQVTACALPTTEPHPSNISHAEPDLRWVFLQTATALDYLHRHPLAICNRDVKLENMLVFGYDAQHCDGKIRPCVKLADFGFCKSHCTTEFNSQERTRLGTSYYAAPEVFGLIPAGAGGFCGSKADVWSAGIALFTLATGLRPFHYKPQDNAATIMQRAACQEHVDRLFSMLELNGASEGLVDLLQHMLTINPSERYSMYQVLKHPWSRKLDVDFIVTGPTGQPVHAPVWQSMWTCVQSDVREACTAYGSPRAETEWNEFGWSMPHLEYVDVEQMLKKVQAIGNPFVDSDTESESESERSSSRVTASA